MAVEKGTFLGCNGWDDRFDYPLGDPTAPASSNGTHMSRSFASGTTVLWEIATESGTVSWAAQQAQ